MGEKSIQKRKYILEKAREVFCQKGYRTVTMKEIVEACGISRGGLYLHFTNIKDLFEAVLAQEYTDAQEMLQNVSNQTLLKDLKTINPTKNYYKKSSIRL